MSLKVFFWIVNDINSLVNTIQLVWHVSFNALIQFAVLFNFLLNVSFFLLGYSYAGLEDSNKCYCGDSYNYQTVKLENYKCDSYCSDKSYGCGGDNNQMTIYNTNYLGQAKRMLYFIMLPLHF